MSFTVTLGAALDREGELVAGVGGGQDPGERLGVGAGVPPADLMTSPGRSPARSAGPPLVTATMPVPAGAPSVPVTVPTWAPIAARCELVTLPEVMSW